MILRLRVTARVGGPTAGESGWTSLSLRLTVTPGAESEETAFQVLQVGPAVEFDVDCDADLILGYDWLRAHGSDLALLRHLTRNAGLGHGLGS